MLGGTLVTISSTLFMGSIRRGSEINFQVHRYAMKEKGELVPKTSQDNPIYSTQESMAECCYNLVLALFLEGLGTVS